MKKVCSLLLSFLLTMAFLLPAAAQTSYLYASFEIPAGEMRVVAHRGYSAVAPENTLPAFRLAGEAGFWGAECDIHQTADGVWVVSHDTTIDRMTDGESAIADFTYDELLQYTIDAGNGIGDYPGLKTMVWTVDNIETANRYYGCGVRDLTTNSLVPEEPPCGRFLRRLAWTIHALWQRFLGIFGRIEAVP